MSPAKDMARKLLTFPAKGGSSPFAEANDGVAQRSFRPRPPGENEV